MGRLTVVDAFISSPGDCGDERAAVHRAVEAYNRVSIPAHQTKVHAFGPAELYSAHGEYAQEGINRQLQRYELHIGLWREAPGTPTPSAPSGTVEELRLALARHARTRRPWVMCYFWKGSSTNFDVTKDELKQHGWYYHAFRDRAELEQLFFTHLSGYIRDEYRLAGHSTTRLDPRAASGPQRPTLTFQVLAPDGTERRVSFERSLIAVGRQPGRNDIVLTSDRVHREQGAFTWKDGVVFYADLAGDSRYEPAPTSGGSPVAYGLQTMHVGDVVTMPDGSRVVLRAVVD
jgi:hypothetical protein